MPRHKTDKKGRAGTRREMEEFRRGGAQLRARKDQWPNEGRGSKMKERCDGKKKMRQSRVSVAKMRAEKMKRLAAGRKWQNDALWRWGEHIAGDKVCVVWQLSLTESRRLTTWRRGKWMMGASDHYRLKTGGNSCASFTQWLLPSAQSVRNVFNSKCRHCFHKRHWDQPAKTGSLAREFSL